MLWFKVPHVDAGATRTFHLHYGSDLVASASDGRQVFPVFDDFETGDLSAWSVYGSVSAAASGDSVHGGSWSRAVGPSTCVSSCFGAYAVTFAWAGALNLPVGTWLVSYFRREPNDWGGQLFLEVNLVGIGTDPGLNSNSQADSGWYKTTFRVTTTAPLTSLKLTELDLTSRETVYLDDLWLTPDSPSVPVPVPQ